LLLVAGGEKAREFILFALGGVAWFAAHLTITRGGESHKPMRETFTARQRWREKWGANAGGPSGP
jgi:hypothetical protein